MDRHVFCTKAASGRDNPEGQSLCRALAGRKRARPLSGSSLAELSDGKRQSPLPPGIRISELAEEHARSAYERLGYRPLLPLVVVQKELA